ncbi:MAG: alcohol dehydrogenase, partial [Labilithrix sp.]|nr:alcohol dehydrogenase [Labilithrix sp.]
MRAEYFQHSGGTVSTEGMLAQYAVLPETALVRIPSHLSYEQASTLPCAAVTAWDLLMEPTPRWSPGATVVVLGTGGVSIFAAQLALAAGLRVIATSSSDAKIARLRELGVADVINYRTTPDWQKEVLRLTGGEGADHVVEVGGAGTMPRSFEAVKTGGVVSLIGFLTGANIEVNPLPVLLKSIRLEGLVVGSVPMFESLNRSLEALRLVPVIDEVFPLDRATEALAKMEAASHFGKIVIRVD